MDLELSYDNIVSLIKIVAASSLTSFSLENNGLKIVMESNRSIDGVLSSLGEKTGSAHDLVLNEDFLEATAKEHPGWCIKAPFVGTFYESSEVGADPYVSEGDSVKKGQILGIIETMKIMNEVTSDADGIIEKILVKNGQVLGYHDPMFIVKV